MHEQWNNLSHIQFAPRVRRLITAGALLTALVPAACSGGDSSAKNTATSRIMFEQSDGWFVNSPQDGLMVNIRYDESYAGGSENL